MDETAVLRDADRIAVVGCSRTPGKAAHDVPAFLQERGYDVVPVNPNAETVLGEPAYDALGDVPGHVDVVDVFRPSEEVAGVVAAAIDHGDVDAVWLQRGIRDDAATRRAEAAGLTVVQDRCAMRAYRDLAD